jgi:hypothetical protein
VKLLGAQGGSGARSGETGGGVQGRRHSVQFRHIGDLGGCVRFAVGPGTVAREQMLKKECGVHGRKWQIKNKKEGQKCTPPISHPHSATITI